MPRRTRGFLPLAALAAAAALTSAGALRGLEKGPAVRRFEATYVGTIPALPPDARRVDVWLPLPQDHALQSIRDLKIEAPAPYTIGKDSGGNAVAHFTLDPSATKGQETIVKVRFVAERKEALSVSAPPEKDDRITTGLGENRMVPLTARVRALARQLAGSATDPIGKAKAFYNYLVENGTYDKTTPGWGRGDSERFCDLKKGNCTDFHSAFMALARAEGIPVRFVIGFPLKPEREGTVPGYHCWAEFYVPGRGWMPVDASDASKAKEPERRRYLFGNLDADRFDMTRGRDLVLSPAQKDGPLNFFIYPYVEVDGKSLPDTKIRLEYQDLPAGGHEGTRA